MNELERARTAAEQLLALPGVVGVAEGETDAGEPAVVVMVASATVAAVDLLPQTIHDVPVTVREVGELTAWGDGASEDSTAGSIPPGVGTDVTGLACPTCGRPVEGSDLGL